MNNAGIPVQRGSQLTEDGLDIVIQTNYLAHFLLTSLLKVGASSLRTSGHCHPDQLLAHVLLASLIKVGANSLGTAWTLSHQTNYLAH